MRKQERVYFVFQEGFRFIVLPGAERIEVTSCEDGCLIDVDGEMNETVKRLNKYVGHPVVEVYCDSNRVEDAGTLRPVYVKTILNREIDYSYEKIMIGTDRSEWVKCICPSPDDDSYSPLMLLWEKKGHLKQISLPNEKMVDVEMTENEGEYRLSMLYYSEEFDEIHPSVSEIVEMIDEFQDRHIINVFFFEDEIQLERCSISVKEEENGTVTLLRRVWVS